MTFQWHLTLSIKMETVYVEYRISFCITKWRIRAILTKDKTTNQPTQHNTTQYNTIEKKYTEVTNTIDTPQHYFVLQIFKQNTNTINLSLQIVYKL